MVNLILRWHSGKSGGRWRWADNDARVKNWCWNGELVEVDDQLKMNRQIGEEPDEDLVWWTSGGWWWVKDEQTNWWRAWWYGGCMVVPVMKAVVWRWYGGELVKLVMMAVVVWQWVGASCIEGGGGTAVMRQWHDGNMTVLGAGRDSTPFLKLKIPSTFPNILSLEASPWMLFILVFLALGQKNSYA